MVRKMRKRADFLPFCRPCLGSEEREAALEVLASDWLTTGPQVEAFERAFAGYVSSANAIAVSSCTAGLHLALAALDIGPGDEVVVPTMTFCASANVVFHVGATPVLVDVGEDLNLDVDRLEQAVTPRTKAIIAVHYAGQPCDLDAVYSIASRHALAVVEDAAHAVGAEYKGKKIGSDKLSAAHPDITRVTAFSFYATKNMTTAEGGMVVLANDALADRVRMLALHGLSRDAWKRYAESGSWNYDVVAAGFKYNMTDLQAAVGIAQLKKLDGMQRARSTHVAAYDTAFASLPVIKPLPRKSGVTHANHLYVVRLSLADLSIDRAEFVNRLRQFNIGSSVHFIPLHLHSFYKDKLGEDLGRFPEADRLFEEIVSLPLFSCMSDADREDVISATAEILEDFATT